MGRILKSYLAFTSVEYRIWGLCFFPLLFLGISLFNGNLMFGGFVVVFEIISDYWLFSGICEKNSSYLEYCKTSVRGMEIISKGLAGDLLRRFFYLLILAVTVYFRSESVWVFAQVLLIYLLSVAALNVTRLWSGVLIQFMLPSFAFLAYVLIQVFLYFPAVSVTVVVLAVLTVFVSIITVWHAVIRMKGSYYEKGND